MFGKSQLSEPDSSDAGYGFHVDLARSRHWKATAAGTLYLINDVWPIDLTSDLLAGGEPAKQHPVFWTKGECPPQIAVYAHGCPTT
jgi:hypothetical protein